MSTVRCYGNQELRNRNGFTLTKRFYVYEFEMVLDSGARSLHSRGEGPRVYKPPHDHSRVVEPPLHVLTGPVNAYLCSANSGVCLKRPAMNALLSVHTATATGDCPRARCLAASQFSERLATL
jgi:hypothetical protein